MADSPEHLRRPTALGWCARALLTGSALGACLGVVGALALVATARAPGSLPIRFTQLTGSALFTTAVVGLGALLLGALTFPLLRWRGGRTAAVSLFGAIAGAFALAHLASAALRFLSGAYLSIGAIDFLLAGGSHLVLTMVRGYSLPILALIALSGSVGFVVALRMRSVSSGAPSTGPLRFELGRASLPVALAGLAFLPAHFVRNLDLASPELAFVASLDPEPIDPEPPDEEASSAAPQAHERPHPEVVAGPPQSEGEKWAGAVVKLPKRHTNVLLLTLESLSPKHLGYMGYARATTPNLDRIASQSVRFRRAWTTATHSNYAQMAILSSLFPRRQSGLDVYKRLDYPRVLLHDVFHELGYATATISSQDETWQGMIKFEQTGTPTFFRHSRDFEGLTVDIGSELVVLDHVTVGVAADWIRRQGDKPWSLYVNLQATHFPYRLMPGIPAPYQPTTVTRGQFNYLSYPESDHQAVVNRYDNALQYVDEQIGKLEKSLDRLGELEDTIWIITADHAEAFHDHGQVTHGKTLYDSEARVPLLVHWPAKLEPADVDEPVSTLDVLPTVLELLGLPPHPAFQGRSFAEPDAHAKNPTGVFMNIQGLRSAEALVCWPWKLIVDRSDRSVHLFNLDRDPGELDDCIEQEPDAAQALRATLGAQINAQLEYHKKGSPALEQRFAPRLLACPSLAGPREVATTPESKPPARTTPDDPRRPSEAPGARPRERQSNSAL
jgi:arylsulfatase A-like enzyme